jgi:hypothetical protein
MKSCSCRIDIRRQEGETDSEENHSARGRNCPEGGLSMRKKSIAFLVAFALIVSSVPAFAEPPKDGMVIDTAGQLLVVDPCKFTFVRPLGDFDYKVGTAEIPKTGGNQ